MLWYDSIKNNDIDGVKRWVSEGGKVRGDDTFGTKDLPLIAAAQYGRHEIIKYLVSLNADVTSQNNRAVFSACSNGDFETMNLLISFGANPYDPNRNTLGNVCSRGHFEMVRYLVDRGADIDCKIGYAPVYMAVCAGQWNIVRYLINKDCSLSTRGLVSCLISNKKWDLVELLLEKGLELRFLSQKERVYIRQRRAYRKWRRVHNIAWIRKVLLPIYYSPIGRGGKLAKQEIERSLNETKK